MSKIDNPQYRKDYKRGWRFDRRGGAPSSYDGGNLGYADEKGWSSIAAWMDGFLDSAAGREKWHLALCENHDEH